MKRKLLDINNQIVSLKDEHNNIYWFDRELEEEANDAD